jgi:hypothetical protein
MIARCPIALASYDHSAQQVMQAAIWTEPGRSIGDVVPNPSAGLMAAVQALHAEFSTLKRKTTEEQVREAQAKAGAQSGG